MAIHSRHIRGNLAFYDTFQKRLVDAIGLDVIKYEAHASHFSVAGTDPPRFTTTMVEAGLGGDSDAIGSTEAGATFEVITDNADNDGVSLQLTGESFELTSDQDLYFGCKFKINDVTQSDFFMGLAIVDTAILAGVTDRIGFQSLDAAATMTSMLEKDSTETLSASLATIVDATYVTAEFYWDGSGVEFFVDGASASVPAVTNLPNDEALRLSLEFLTGAAVAQTMTVQWMRCLQIGR